MKLQELGLKTKPETKYFANGYVSFSTSQGDLHFEIVVWSGDKSRATHSPIKSGSVDSKEQLDNLMKITSVYEAANL